MTLNDEHSTDFARDEQFWQRVDRGFRAFETPQELQKAAMEAFEWLHKHPKRKQLTFHHKGQITRSYETLERPFSFRAVAMVMGLSSNGLSHYRERPEFEDVMAWIDDVIYTQKFEGAAVGTLNANFIARDLGLVDRNELTGKDGGPLKTHQEHSIEEVLNEARRLGIDPTALGLGGGTQEA